jgi:Protein of unknown function (DUF3551)
MQKLARLGLALVVTATLASFSSTIPAKADANAPFCLNPHGTIMTACDYYTLEQCKAAGVGIGGGSCAANLRQGPRKMSKIPMRGASTI